MDKSLSSVTPSSCTLDWGSIETLPMMNGERSIWCCILLVAHHINSVLSGFSLNLFETVHAETFSMQRSIFARRAAVLDDGQLPHACVSSAYP